MPIESCTLPGGGSGFRWGARGKCYADRKDAERQESAARAHGWAADEKPRSLYVSRKLLNADALIAWAKEQGFEKTLAGDDMHVTIAYSKQPVNWSAAGDHFDTIRASNIDPGERSVKQLGEQGVVVLCFDNPDLRRRWQEFRDIGASWDWDGYQSHVTFTYEPGSVDMEKVVPYTGPLEFGPEQYVEVDESWKPKQAQDAALKLANDKAMQVKQRPSSDAIAMDKASVRTFNADGRMRVEIANISKANVCPYYGEEIPDCQQLGLEPRRKYMLLRDPAELEKAVPSFNGLPLLDAHVPSTAWDHPSGKVVGTTGTDASFEAPYLKNSLVIWTQDAIDGIESGEQRELSSAYRYRADMTPGTYDGQQYDGVMRDILGNHVALVATGRAGPDVLVGDSQPGKETGMTKVKALSRRAAMARGALMVTLKPTMLAKDAKLDYGALFEGVTSANWKESKPKIAAAIKPKLAADADLQDVVKLLDTLDAVEEGMDDDPAVPAAVDGDPIADILAMCKGKLSDDEMAAMGEKLKALKPAAADVVAPVVKKPEGEGEKDMVSKNAMDAALKQSKEDADKAIKLAADAARAEAEANTIKRLRSIGEAEAAVQPYVGKLAVAFDSAEAVYRAALDNLSIANKGIHESALRAVLEAQPKPGAIARMAVDSAPQGFADRFPGVAAIRTL